MTTEIVTVIGNGGDPSPSSQLGRPLPNALPNAQLHFHHQSPSQHHHHHHHPQFGNFCSALKNLCGNTRPQKSEKLWKHIFLFTEYKVLTEYKVRKRN